MKLTFSNLGAYFETLVVVVIGGIATAAAGYTALCGIAGGYNWIAKPEKPLGPGDMWGTILKSSGVVLGFMHLIGFGSN